MKAKLFVITILGLVFFNVLLNKTANAQCTDLIISEYIEGWSNNKALEIYNPTSAAIQLSGYRIVRYSNGSDVPPAENQWFIKLPSHSLAAYKSYVVVLDKQDTSQTGQEAAVWEELRNVADVFLCPDYNVSKAMYFNGNDAVALEKLDGTFIDIFGRIGENPGDAWNNIGPDFTTASNGGIGWTKDHTLIRKSSVKTGVITNPAKFDVGAEWDTLAANFFMNLGCHKCDCDPQVATVNCKTSVGLKELLATSYLNIFPVPASDHLTISSDQAVTRVEVFNTLNQLVKNSNFAKGQKNIMINTGDLKNGMYFLRTTHGNKYFGFKKIIVSK